MSETRRNLVIVWTYLDWGGAQVYLLAIVKRAVKEWNVIVALPKDSSAEITGFVEQTGARVEFLERHIDTGSAPTLGRKLSRQLSRIKSEIEVLGFFRRFSARNSVVHLETSPWQSWIFLTVLAVRGINVFVTLHNPPGTESSLRYFIWKCRLNFVTNLKRIHLFASNKFTKQGIRSLVAAKAWEAIPVTYTAIDPEQIDGVLAQSNPRTSMRSRLGIADDAVVVLTVGQFIDRKGRWVLLDAAKKLHDSGVNLTFVWMSPTDLSPSDRARVDEYGLGDAFEFVLSSTIGTTRDEILSFFRIADIFALPSYVEGLPIALLEAMALGIPVVSTKVYAIPEAVEDGVNGLLIGAGDEDALAGAIAQLGDDADLRKRLGDAARTKVIREFDEREVADIAIAAYERALG